MVEVSGLPIDILGKLYRASVSLPEQPDIAPGADLQQTIDGIDTAEAGAPVDGLHERSARH